MENKLSCQLNSNSTFRRGLPLICLVTLSWLLPSDLNGFQKHSIDFSVGQYHPRENGAFELDFVYPNSGAPRFGIADIVPITSKETVKLLELDDQQLHELDRIRKSAREAIRALIEEKKSTEEIEKQYKKQVLEVLTEEQEKEWDWFNSRAVFFSGGLLNFLKREDVSTALGLTKEQIESIKDSRPQHAAWLKSEINKLFEEAIEKAIDATSNTTRKRVLELFDFQNWEQNASIGTPSTLYWFFNNSKNNVHFDLKLGFVQTTWRINLNSEIVCTNGSSYSTGMANLTRFHYYYGQNIAGKKQAEIVEEEIGFFSLADDLSNFYDRNEETGKVPFIEHMENFFKRSQANQSNDSFDRFAFQSIVGNAGLVNALENKVQFKETPFAQDDIEKIKKNSDKVAKFLREGADRILSNFVLHQIRSLTSKQAMQLEGMLILPTEEAEQMIPLELVYLGIVMADSDRSSYRLSKSIMSGYRLPDFDLIEEAQAKSSERKIIDKRKPRFTIEQKR